MSIKIMTLVFEVPYKPTPKIILLSLADNADDVGKCYPSLRTLMAKASIGKTNLVRILNVFEKINLIRREKRKRANGSQTSTLYSINTQKLTTLSEKENIKKVQKEYDEIYQAEKIPKKSLSEQAGNSLSEQPKKQKVNGWPVHSSEHLEPPYINLEEERKLNNFEKFYSWLPKEKIRNEKWHKNKLLKNLLDNEPRTLDNYRHYLEEQMVARPQEILIEQAEQQFKQLCTFLAPLTSNKIFELEKSEEYKKRFEPSTNFFITLKGGLVELSSSIDNPSFHAGLLLTLTSIFAKEAENDARIFF